MTTASVSIRIDVLADQRRAERDGRFSTVGDLVRRIFSAEARLNGLPVGPQDFLFSPVKV